MYLVVLLNRGRVSCGNSIPLHVTLLAKLLFHMSKKHFHSHALFFQVSLEKKLFKILKISSTIPLSLDFLISIILLYFHEKAHLSYVEIPETYNSTQLGK
jgi:hypothetical protein